MPHTVRTWWSAFGRLAARRGLMVVACGVITLLGCLAMDVIRGRDPRPEVHDEYAYVLAGDTFVHGRLTNPPHPLWRSFETFHEIQRPTYQAKYPPGQGLFLALGTVLGGRPIVGVWLSDALFVGALCWMLQGWFPPRWAVIGALIGAVTMVFSGNPFAGGPVAYWSQSYWGGAVAALGGALLLGGFRRLVSPQPSWHASLVMGLGASILALSRPFEGLLVALPAGVVLAVWLVSGREPKLPRRILLLLPAAGAVAIGLGWLAYYNFRVTGDALRMPYMVYRDQYQMAPIWTWQPLREMPPGINLEMAKYAQWEYQAGRMQLEPLFRAKSFCQLLAFEAGPALFLALIVAMPWLVRRRWMAFAAISALFVLALMWTSSYVEVHYHAPAAALTVILAVGALRRITLLRWRRPLGPTVAGVLVCLTIGYSAWLWVPYLRAGLHTMEGWALSRQEVIDRLTSAGGKHVVFVRYFPEHRIDCELVFNGADIDSQAVVWVRELDPEQNNAVLRYYADRTPWLMVISDDHKPAQMVPLKAASVPEGG